MKFLGFIFMLLLMSVAMDAQNLPFYDNFNNGPRPEWNIIGNYWDFSNGKVYSNIVPYYQYEYMIVGDNTWKNYTYEVDVEGTQGTDKEIAFRVQDQNNYYFLHLIGPIQYHDLWLDKYVNGHPTNLFNNKNYTVLNNVNYHIKVRVNNDTIKVFINGQLEINLTDNTYLSGGVGLFAGYDGYAPCFVNFDNVSVVPIDKKVIVDIKPQSCPNPINVKSKGVLPVAILGTNDFDVKDIDPSSIRLQGISAIRWNYEDVSAPSESANGCNCTTNGADGYQDMTLKFSTQEIVQTLGNLNNNEKILTITGNLYDGTSIKGNDCVIVKGIKLKKNASEVLQQATVIKNSLNGNYPNPFNPSTIIQYSLKESGFVSLKVYDMLGREVKTLVNKEQNVGIYKVKFNGSDLSSGIYIYRIVTNNFVESKEMILMK